MSITHKVQTAEMQLSSACDTIQDFCASANLFFQPAITATRQRQADARIRDIACFGEIGEDSTYEGGEEHHIGSEVVSLEQGLKLVGLFALVYLTSALETFLEHVTRSCGWQIQKREGSNLRKFRSVIEEKGGFSFNAGAVPFEYIEELFLARNAFLHNRGVVSQRYLAKAQVPRFAKDQRIVFTLNHVGEATEAIPKFAGFIVAECKPFSRSFP